MTEEKAAQDQTTDRIAPLFERSRRLIRESHATVERTAKLLEQSKQILSGFRKASAKDFIR